MVRNVLLSLSLAAVALAAPIEVRQTPACVSGLYILVARGSTEVGGDGVWLNTSSTDIPIRPLAKALLGLLQPQ